MTTLGAIHINSDPEVLRLVERLEDVIDESAGKLSIAGVVGCLELVKRDFIDRVLPNEH